jgi:hypothetical protein
MYSLLFVIECFLLIILIFYRVGGRVLRRIVTVWAILSWMNSCIPVFPIKAYETGSSFVIAFLTAGAQYFDGNQVFRI